MGYSQSDRQHFDPTDGNCDCSSLVIHCLKGPVCYAGAGDLYE